MKKIKEACQQNDIKENIFVARKGGKQQKAAMWSKLNISQHLTLDLENLAIIIQKYL